MARDRDADVDPRFDPVFQRGYDPGKHRTRVRPAEPPRVEERREAPRLETAAPESPTHEGAATPTPADDAAPPRRNPFRLILLLVSLAAIAGAGFLLWRRIADDPYGGYGGYGGDVGRVFVQQLIDALLTPLLTGGLLGLCLWLALGALRRRDHG